MADDVPLPRQPPDSPTGSQVLRFWDDPGLNLPPLLLPINDDAPPPPLFDQPPAALENQHEWDRFVDDVIRTPEEYRVERHEESDHATKLKEHGGGGGGGGSVVYEIVEWPTICHDEYIVGSGNRGRVVRPDHYHVEQNVAVDDEVAPPALQNDEAIGNLFDDFPTPERNVALEDILGWNPFDDDGAIGEPDQEIKDGVERQECDAAANSKEQHGGGDRSVANEIVEHQLGIARAKGVDQQDDADEFPFPGLPPDCYSCTALRIIIHCTETVTKRMEIHRRINSSFHVIICTETEGKPPVTHHEIVELQNFEMAEPFLVEYFRRREDDAHDLVFDSNDMNTIQLVGSLPSTSTSIATLQPPLKKRRLNDLQQSHNFYGPTGEWIGLPRLPKSRTILQRERAAKMDLDDLKRYMHLPEAEAAKRLGVCATVIKKVCRRNGLPRWPYRKIRAIDRSIASTERSLEEAMNDPHMKEELLREIGRLNNERELACQGKNDGVDDGSEEENEDD